MTKRRAERASLDGTPNKKHRCISDPRAQLEPAHAPPLLAVKRRRKRASCSDEDQDSPEQETVRYRKAAQCDTEREPEHAQLICTSRKFHDASRRLEQSTCERPTVCPKQTETKPEDRTRVMETDVEDELCQFNSFQFWRTPLPVLDLSILDAPSTAELGKDVSLRDAAEAMET